MKRTTWAPSLLVYCICRPLNTYACGSCQTNILSKTAAQKWFWLGCLSTGAYTTQAILCTLEDCPTGKNPWIAKNLLCRPSNWTMNLLFGCGGQYGDKGTKLPNIASSFRIAMATPSPGHRRSCRRILFFSGFGIDRMATLVNDVTLENCS